MADLNLRLANLVSEKKTIFNNVSKKPIFEKQKRDAWVSIVSSINAEFASNYTAEQIRQKYKYLKGHAKTAHAKNIKSIHKTGGGTQEIVHLNAADDLIIGDHSHRPGFSGISNGMETQVISTTSTDTTLPLASTSAAATPTPVFNNITPVSIHAVTPTRSKKASSTIHKRKKTHSDLQTRVLEEQLEVLGQQKILFARQMEVCDKLNNLIEATLPIIQHHQNQNPVFYQEDNGLVYRNL